MSASALGGATLYELPRVRLALLPAAWGALQLSLAPVIASWLWRDDGTLLFKFLGAIDVTYVLESKKNSWEATITSYELEGADGKKTKVEGPTVPAAIAKDVRALKYSAIKVTLE